MPRVTPLFLAAPLAALLVLGACSDDESPGPVVDRYQEIIDAFGLEPLLDLPYPEGNGPHPARISLGKLLFFDPILGGESAPWVKSAAGKDPYRYRANDMACATCHHPSLGFADGRLLSAGVGGAQFADGDLGPDRVAPGRSLVTGAPVGIVPRNAPTCLNAGCNGRESPEPAARSTMFLDGRVDEGLDRQALFPFTSRDEMAGDAYELPPGLSTAEVQEAIRDSVVQRLRDIPEYVERFRHAFPGEIASAADMTAEHVGRALGAYQRELFTPNSRYDRFLMGRREALNDVETRGFELFFTKGLCGDCHHGPMLSDYRFVVQGVADGYEKSHPGFEGKNGQGGDWGRYHADPVKYADQRFAFRTLTIRNVEITGPYFHSGSAATLHEAVAFYNRGGRGSGDVSDQELAAAGVVRHPSIRPLGLTADEIDAIVAFMKTTTAPVQPGPSGFDLVSVPPRVPSGLLPPGIPTPQKPGPYYPERDLP